MINPTILSQSVRKKLENACLTAIVTETFMQALPFTTEGIISEAKKYTSYVNTVMESLHCENMLSTAMMVNRNNPAVLNLLSTVQEAINTVVVPATNRIVMEATENKETNMQKVVDKTAFTEAEKKRLTEAKSEIPLKTISEIIKKKVVNTIKEEKEAYDAALKLKSDIKENLEDTLGESAPSIESYMDIVLKKGDPRDYISFFSRLQDVCMESLMQFNDNSSDDPEYVSLECLVNTTINSTLSAFDKTVLSTDTSLDILSKAVEAVELVPTDKTNLAQKSLIMSVVITTIMETLKTLNLWTPSLADLKEFIDSPTANNTPVKNLTDKVHKELQDTKKMASNPDADKKQLAAALGCFNQIKERVSGISEKVLPNKDDLIKEITEAATIVESVIAKESTGNDDDGMDYWTTRARESNIAEFDRVARIMFRNSDTKKVQLVCESECPFKKENVVTIRGLSALGSITDQITACITMTPAFKDLVTELKTASKFSKLGDYTSQSEIYFPDKCRALSLADPEV